jgi:hypothetical protein
MPVIPNAMHCAAIHALLVHTCPANDASGVADELVVGVVLELLGATKVEQQLRVGAEPHPVDGRNHRKCECCRDRQPANPIESRGQLVHKKRGELTEDIGGCRGETQSCPAQRQRQPIALDGLPRCGCDGRQLARSGLISLDQFVGFNPGKPGLCAQLGKAIPLFAVSGGVGV